MLIQFLKYSFIGIFNTIHHWFWFFLLVYLCGLSGEFANVLAFIFSAAISYFLNSRITFKKEINKKSFMLFIIFMAILSYMVGYFSLMINIELYLVPIVFSIISLIVGFLYSKYIVFYER